MTSVELHPIGRVHGGRSEPVDDDWGDVTAAIVLEPHLDATSLAGIDAFSHVEVVFLFHLVDPDAVVLGARRPRGNPDWPEVGIFAQRGKARPNRLGVTVCELVAVEGAQVHVRGLDAIHGTPVLDLKPYLREFGPRGEVRQPDWSTELMRGYWRSVG